MAKEYIMERDEMIKATGELRQLADKFEMAYKGLYRTIDETRAVAYTNADMKEYYIAIKSFEVHFKQMKQLVNRICDIWETFDLPLVYGPMPSRLQRLGEFLML